MLRILMKFHQVRSWKKTGWRYLYAPYSRQSDRRNISSEFSNVSKPLRRNVATQRCDSNDDVGRNTTVDRRGTGERACNQRRFFQTSN